MIPSDRAVSRSAQELAEAAGRAARELRNAFATRGRVEWALRGMGSFGEWRDDIRLRCRELRALRVAVDVLRGEDERRAKLAKMPKGISASMHFVPGCSACPMRTAYQGDVSCAHPHAPDELRFSLDAGIDRPAGCPLLGKALLLMPERQRLDEPSLGEPFESERES